MVGLLQSLSFVHIFARKRFLIYVIYLPYIKLKRNPPFAAFFSFKNIKLSIFKFGNNVKHNANHINQPKLQDWALISIFEAVLIAYHFIDLFCIYLDLA